MNGLNLEGHRMTEDLSIDETYDKCPCVGGKLNCFIYDECPKLNSHFTVYRQCICKIGEYLASDDESPRKYIKIKCEDYLDCPDKKLN